MLPIMANCSRYCGRQSTLAPTSSISTGLPAITVGKTAPIAGLSMPFTLPSRSSAAAMAAPECPAETTPSALPFLTKSIDTLIDALGLRRSAFSGSSCISIVPSAGTISMPLSKSGCDTDAFIWSGSPTSNTSMPSSSFARIAPATTSAGA